MSAKRAELTRRLVIRISNDLDTWIGQQAALEGLDNATWARATLTRIMNGIGRPAVSQQYDPIVERHEAEGHPVDLDARVEQALEAASSPSFVTAPPAADDLSHELIGAAQPLRRVDRVKYNPGRGGYG